METAYTPSLWVKRMDTKAVVMHHVNLTTDISRKVLIVLIQLKICEAIFSCFKLIYS